MTMVGGSNTTTTYHTATGSALQLLLEDGRGLRPSRLSAVLHGLSICGHNCLGRYMNIEQGNFYKDVYLYKINKCNNAPLSLDPGYPRLAGQQVTHQLTERCPALLRPHLHRDLHCD